MLVFEPLDSRSVKEHQENEDRAVRAVANSIPDRLLGAKPTSQELAVKRCFSDMVLCRTSARKTRRPIFLAVLTLTVDHDVMQQPLIVI